jgi:carboxymethylenebutenolidase
MIELHIDIDTPDGTMNTFVTHPEEGGPHPVVLFYMDAPGKREELHDMARRIGTVGYYVVLPNMYYRTLREYDASKDFTGVSGRMRELIDSLDFDKVATDTTAMLAYVDADPAAGHDVGAVGYCMSGPFAYAMAGLFPERIRAAASIYGVRLHGQRSPQEFAPNVTGELYFGCAELDEYAPSEMVDDLERYVKELGLNARVERYAGAHHGFAFPSRTGAYDKTSCERHYERLFALFDRNLRQSV